MTATPSLLLGAWALRTFGAGKNWAPAAAPVSAAQCWRKRRRVVLVLVFTVLSLFERMNAVVARRPWSFVTHYGRWATDAVAYFRSAAGARAGVASASRSPRAYWMPAR